MVVKSLNLLILCWSWSEKETGSWHRVEKVGAGHHLRISWLEDHTFSSQSQVEEEYVGLGRVGIVQSSGWASQHHTRCGSAIRWETSWFPAHNLWDWSVITWVGAKISWTAVLSATLTSSKWSASMAGWKPALEPWAASNNAYGRMPQRKPHRLSWTKMAYMLLSSLLLSLNRQWTADGLLLFKSRLAGFLSELTTNSTGESGLCYMPAD